jgi:hypothetical protein
MKHFETVWEESEELSTKIRTDDYEIILNNIKIDLEILRSCEKEEQAETIGRILFEISALSKKFNINVYSALSTAMEEAKIDFYSLQEEQS